MKTKPEAAPSSTSLQITEQIMIVQKENCSKHLAFYYGNDGIWTWKTFIFIQRSHSICFCLMIRPPLVTCSSGNAYMPMYLYCLWVCLPSLVFCLHTRVEWRIIRQVKISELRQLHLDLKTPVQVSVNSTTGALAIVKTLFLFKPPQRTW